MAKFKNYDVTNASSHLTKWLNNLIEMICTILNDNITSNSWKDPPEPEATPAHLKEYNGFFSEKPLDITINLVK